MNLHDAMVSDPEFDAKPTDLLQREATESPVVTDRAASLWALSKRISVANLPEFVKLLEHPENQRPLMFGSLPVNHSAIIALLVNSSGEVLLEAEKLWFNLSFVIRHDLKTWLDKEGLDLPLLETEDELLDKAIAVADERMGPGDWFASPTADGKAITVKERHPGTRAIIVSPDGSAAIPPGPIMESPDFKTLE